MFIVFRVIKGHVVIETASQNDFHFRNFLQFPLNQLLQFDQKNIFFTKISTVLKLV